MRSEGAQGIRQRVLDAWEHVRLAARRRRLAKGGAPKRSKASWSLLVSLVVLLAAVVWSFSYLRPETPGTQRTLTALSRALGAGQVRAATVLDEDSRVVVRDVDGRTSWTAYPADDALTGALLEDLVGAGVPVRIDAQTAKGVVRTVLTVLLPLMVLANLFALFFLSAGGGGTGLGEVVSFGRVGGRKSGGTRAAVTFDDVAGVDEARVELSEVVDYLTDPTRFEALGAAPPKGVLLFGPPGCGKTLLARAVAGEADVPFFAVAGAEFVESLVGVGAARVRDLFARVRAVAPAIVFIDELDAAGRRRGSGASGGGSDERDQTLNQLLVEMDGFDVSTGIVVIGATNRPDILDPALLRPGRFDRHITVEKPDQERRLSILRLHSRNKPVDADVDFETLARRTPGFSGADLASVVNEAALLAIRDERSNLSSADFSEAVERVRSGPQRRGHLLSAEETRRLAVREAGRATVLALTGRADEVHRLSAVGTRLTPLEREEADVVTRSALQDRLAAALAGRVAEELLLGEGSTATEQDVAEATALAVDLVARYGLNEAIGPRRLLAEDAAHYLGDTGFLAELSAEAHARLDEEVDAALDHARQGALTLLRRARPALERLVEALTQEETIEGEELAALLPGPLPEPRSSSRGGRR